MAKKIELPDLARRRPAPAATGQPRRPSPAFGIDAADAGRYREVPIDHVHGDPDQPRRSFDSAKLKQLAQSITDRGILQPPVVRPDPDDEDHYIVVAGERRLRAARLAGLTTIGVLIRHADNTESLALALMENVVREDLTPVEEARAVSTLLRDLDVTQQTLGRHLGISQPEVANTVRLLELPDDVLDLVDTGKLTKSHGRALLTEPDHGRRRILARKAVEQGWSVRQLSEQAARAPQAQASPHTLRPGAAGRPSADPHLRRQRPGPRRGPLPRRLCLPRQGRP